MTRHPAPRKIVLPGTSRELTRRTVMLGGLGLTGLIVAACSSDDNGGTSGNGTETPTPELGGEAPTLAERVAAGELPPVEERLPLEPMVVEPVESIGQYGGTWQSVLEGPGDFQWCFRTIGYEGLVRWVPDWTGAPGNDEIIPNVAKSYEVNADGTEYTFILREGMKWSDGEPFTTADIEFAYTNVMLNSDIVSAVPAAFSVGGEPATLRIDDEYTFALTFAQPSGLLLTALADAVSGELEMLIAPKHYLSQFHPDFATDIDAVAAAEGFSSWPELFVAKQQHWANADLPVLHGWAVTTPLGEGTQVVAERNPYYWKTDPEGNQLPYLDAVEYQVIDQPEVIVASAAQGDIDMDTRHSMTPVNKPVLAEARDNGGFDFIDVESTLSNQLIIMLNLTIEDPVLREVFTNKNFRIGLSHAINRQELIDTVYQRQGEPAQLAPIPTSPFYSEEMAKQFTEYDVALANQFLDEAGYQRNSSGQRLGPGGDPISFVVECTNMPANSVDIVDVIAGYWGEVGVTIRPEMLDRSLWEEHRLNNLHQANAFVSGGGSDVISNTQWYVPHNTTGYAGLWANWYNTDGAEGEEPPEQVRQQLELYDQLQQTPDADGQQEVMTQILQITAEQLYHIGTAFPAPGYGIVKDNFHNVPASMVESFKLKTPGLTNPEQYYKSS